jgi:hypothetical protein
MSEQAFTRELARHADDVHGAPLTFEDVRSTARRIRRRRRAGMAAAVAAVVAVIAVVPVLLSGGNGHRAPQPAPSPVPSPSRTLAPGASVLHDRTLSLPSGDTVHVDVDNEDVSQIGVLTDGRVVVAMTKPYAIRVYDADGSLQEQYPVGANVITMSAADDAVAWVAEDLTVRVLASGSAEPTSLPGIPMPGEAVGSIDAVLDPGHLLVGDHTTTTGELTADGVRRLRTAEPLRVADVSPDGGLWAVSFLPTADQQYGCTGLYDPGADRVVARSCEVYLTDFAPDSEHLLSAFYENNMASDVRVVDLQLGEVGRIAPEGGTSAVSRIGWVDATHLVAGVADTQSPAWTLVRSDLDGALEVLGGQTAGANPELAAEYLISD